MRASAKVVSHHADTEPADTMAAQYSVPWCVAVGLRADPMDPESFGTHALNDPRLRALCRAVRCEAMAAGALRGGWASEVALTLKDGRVLTRAEDDFPGTPTSPLSTPALREKYLRCAGDFEGAAHLLAQLEQVDTLPDVRALALG